MFRRASEPHAVGVLKWSPERNGLGVALYVTATERVLPKDQGGHQVEFLVGLSPEEDGCASALATLPVAATSEAVGHAHTFEVQDGLWPGTDMNCWLLLNQSLVPAGQVAGMQVDYLQAVPLYPAERTWKTVHGADALLAAWEAQGVPFWDPHRPPHVPSA
jgi:hypothetical protein